jgi:flagellar protein FliS
VCGGALLAVAPAGFSYAEVALQQLLAEMAQISAELGNNSNNNKGGLMSTTGKSHTLSAIENASPIGLMVVLFDTLAGDLRRAVAALNKNDIETRCKELNHAVLVIGQLDSWVDLEKGGESARNLTGFYAYIRAKMMEAAVTKSAKSLEAPIQMIQQVSTAWHKLDVAPKGAEKTMAKQVPSSKAPVSGKKQERIPSSQSR